mgnify:CR=1 FL=1
MRAGFTLSDPPNEGCRPNAIALAFSGNNKKFVPNENVIEQKLRTAIKKVLECKKKDEADSLYKNAISIIDKLSQKKIIHSNTAARKKSTLSKFYNSL